MTNIEGRQRDLGLAILLFVLNFVPAYLLINEGLFHMDSVVLAQAVEKTYQTGILQLATLGRIGAVLINSILYLPFFLDGQNADLVTRLSSVLFQGLSAVVAYFFIRALLKDRRSAFFATLLFSFTPLYFVPNTYGKEHGMGMFFLLSSFCVLQRGLKLQSFWLMVLASSIFAFAVAVRESVLVMLPVYILLYALPLGMGPSAKPGKYVSRFSPRALMAFLLPLVAGIGWLWALYLGPIIGPIISGNTAVSVLDMKQLTSAAFLSRMDDLLISMTPLVMLAAFAGIVLLLKAREWWLLAFLVVWAATIVLYTQTDAYTSRHLDMAIVPVYIFAGYALGRLAKKLRGVAIALAVLGALLMFAYIYPMLEFRHSYNGEKRLAMFVGALTEREAMIITQDQYVFMTYYGKRRVLWLPLNNTNYVDGFVNDVGALLKNGVPVYYTDSAYIPVYEAESLRIMSDHFKIKEVGAVLSEDYHRPELQFRFHLQKLYRVIASKDVVR